MFDDTVAALSQGEQGQLGVQQGFSGPGDSYAAGVECSSTPYGVMIRHMFLLTTERSAIVVDGLRHLRVTRLNTIQKREETNKGT